MARYSRLHPVHSRMHQSVQAELHRLQSRHCAGFCRAKYTPSTEREDQRLHCLSSGLESGWASNANHRRTHESFPSPYVPVFWPEIHSFICHNVAIYPLPTHLYFLSSTLLLVGSLTGEASISHKPKKSAPTLTSTRSPLSSLLFTGSKSCAMVLSRCMTTTSSALWFARVSVVIVQRDSPRGIS